MTHDQALRAVYAIGDVIADWMGHRSYARDRVGCVVAWGRYVMARDSIRDQIGGERCFEAWIAEARTAKDAWLEHSE